MGGGSKETQTQVIPIPTTPAPSASETSEQAYQSQLKYNPKLYEQYAQQYAQYLPQLTGIEYQNQAQYAPLYKALQEQLNPGQTQVLPALTQQALQMLNNPYGYSESQQASVDNMRLKQQQDLSKQLRERANLGGGLYGGRTQKSEQEAQIDLSNAFAEQDINRQLQAARQALAYATPALQTMYGNVQAAQVPNYTQSVTPSADQIYQSLYSSSQPNYYIQPGQAATASPLWSAFGSAAGGLFGAML